MICGVILIIVGKLGSLKTNKDMNNNKQLLKVGDKLEALDCHKEEHGLEYVTITSINEEKKVYHWEAKLNWEIGGKLHSGYYFHEAKAYKEKSLTDFINNQQDLNPEYQKIISDNFNDLI